MQPPSSFAESLKEQFGGRLRVRWSWPNSEWHVEERVGKPIPPTRFIDDYDDRGIRYRDGYALMMRIRNGDRMPCPKCRREMKIKVLKVEESKCGSCGTRVMAFHFPLNDHLLERLRWTDPNRGGYERMRKELENDYPDEERMILKRRDEMAALAREDFSQIAGHPVIGYTGKERYQ